MQMVVISKAGKARKHANNRVAIVMVLKGREEPSFSGSRISQ